MEVTDQLGDQESYTFPKGGLGKKGYIRNYPQVDANKTKEAKGMGLKLLRNKDKNTFIRAVASTLLREKKVLFPSEVSLNKVTQEDVSMCSP